MQTYHIKIGGMGCEHCLHAVRKALEAIDGVQVAEVSMGSAVVELRDDALREEIDQAIDEAGYTVLALEPV